MAAVSALSRLRRTPPAGRAVLSGVWESGLTAARALPGTHVPDQSQEVPPRAAPRSLKLSERAWQPLGGR